MARKKKAAEQPKEAVDTLILDGNCPAEEQPKTSKKNRPVLKVDAPSKKEQKLDAPKPKKEAVSCTVSEDAKALRPSDVYGKDEETAAEMGDRLQAEADKYKEELEKYNSKEELEEIEKKWIEKLEQMDKYLSEVKYKMPASAVFNFRTYPRNIISTKISRFICTKEVQFQYTLGMWELVKLWNSNPEELTYSQYNATLETLGSLTFKGMNDWESILTINEFFRASNKEYAKDITAYQYLSTMHSHVVGRIQLVTPAPETQVEGKMRKED